MKNNKKNKKGKKKGNSLYQDLSGAQIPEAQTPMGLYLGDGVYLKSDDDGFEGSGYDGSDNSSDDSYGSSYDSSSDSSSDCGGGDSGGCDGGGGGD